jgi:hypothetical protein
MGGRCEDKDGRVGGNIFGLRRAGSEIFLVVAVGISNRYPKFPKLILGIGCLLRPIQKIKDHFLYRL